MKISEKIGINKAQPELDFFDYDIDKDNLKFIDPYYISKKEDEFLELCDEYIKTFFNRFLDLLKRDEELALDIFSHLGEINEICLGMSKNKPAGKGIGRLNALSIFKSIKKSAALEKGVIDGIEDVRLFIDGVDKDKISDMVANIIKYPLIQYTQEQCKLFGVKLQMVESGYYWNKETISWERGHQEMLVIDDKKYLLFPKILVSDSKYYTPDEYFRHYILNYLQEENIKNDTSLVRKSYNKDGSLKKAWVYKKDIVNDMKSRGECFTKSWVANFSKYNPEVFAKFKRKVINKISDSRHDLIQQEELDELLDKLILELKSISPGTENATKYHRLMYGILELLFYPYIAHPKIEEEINEGRKRVDISFLNIAETGFFFLLANTYNIPCNKIMIECENYSKDLKNPELDQMAGRFSTNRGRFGIVCCRSIEDKELIIDSERDTAVDNRGWIIHLTDEEIIELLEMRKKSISVDNFLISKFDEIISK